MVTSVACNGPCGTSPLTPVDVVLVMDRSSSMSGTDTTNAKAAANSLVGVYDPAIQWLALGTLGPSVTSGGCDTFNASSVGTATAPADLRRWIPVGLSGVGSSFSANYSKVTSGISCYPNSSTGTDLTDPMTMAAYELTHNGRSGVRKGIIFETDGQPNAAVAAGPNYCGLSNAAATAVKAQNIEVFTIGFGLDAASGGDPACPDTSGAFKGKTATELLDSMATQPATGAPTCDAAENADGDHFYCIGKTGASTDLSNIFKAAAASLAKGGSHLVQLYPVPVVNSISPSTGTHLRRHHGDDHRPVLHRHDERHVRWFERRLHGRERHDGPGDIPGRHGRAGQGPAGHDPGWHDVCRGRRQVHLQLTRPRREALSASSTPTPPDPPAAHRMTARATRVRRIRPQPDGSIGTPPRMV